ncbi:MAG: DUF3846 domain-containing protein [Eubacteriales bacterium]|nr:DUF3846 domain-containing protein [Eubacteriales bacterium]
MSENPFALTVLYKQPGEKPEVMEIMNSVGDMDDLVHGKIESQGIDDGVCIIYNNLAVKMSMPLCATIYNQTFYGPIIFVEFDENGALRSLDPANIEYYSSMLEGQ